MPFDIDKTMVIYLGMITAGIFFIADPFPYLALGVGLIVVGGILVVRKSRKKELGTKP